MSEEIISINVNNNCIISSWKSGMGKGQIIFQNNLNECVIVYDGRMSEDFCNIIYDKTKKIIEEDSDIVYTYNTHNEKYVNKKGESHLCGKDE